MRCSKCDKYIDYKLKYWKYCPFCGAEIPEELLPPYVPKRSALAILLSIIGAILLIAVGLTIGIIIYRNNMLTIEEAQEKIDITLREVYQEAAPDNFIVDALEKTVEIQVDSVKQTKDGAYANCTVTSLDLATPILEYTQNLDQDSIDSYVEIAAELIEVISDVNEMEEDYQIEFIRVNGEYTPVFTEELIEFCSGNIHDLLPELYAALQEDAAVE